MFRFHSCSMFNGFPMKIQWQWGDFFLLLFPFEMIDLIGDRICFIVVFCWILSFRWISLAVALLYCRAIEFIPSLFANWLQWMPMLLAPSLSFHCFFIDIHLQFTIYRTCLSNNALSCFYFLMHRSTFFQIFRVPVPNGENLHKGIEREREKTRKHCFFFGKTSCNTLT